MIKYPTVRLLFFGIECLRLPARVFGEESPKSIEEKKNFRSTFQNGEPRRSSDGWVPPPARELLSAKLYEIPILIVAEEQFPQRGYRESLRATLPGRSSRLNLHAGEEGQDGKQKTASEKW